jgi:predicted AAA+ superfamily ATPase
MLIENCFNETKADHIIYINFEEMEYFNIQSGQGLNEILLAKIKDDGKYYFFLDEIQNINSCQKVINGLRLKNTDIYITGSNSKIMSKEFATILGGRVLSFIIYPLSFKEFMAFRKENGLAKESVDLELEDYYDIGGLPRLSVYPYTHDERRKIVSEISSTALLRDVIIRHQVKEPRLLGKLVSFLYDRIGSLISIKSILNYLYQQGRGTNHETIANYIKYLEDAFIIKKAPRYDIKTKRTLKNNEKYYICDHSLAYSGLNKSLDKSQVVIENIVFWELVRRGYDVYVGKFNDKEIDFVALKNDGYMKIYVQVCLDFSDPETYKREFTPLKAIKDSHPKYVVTSSKWWEINDEGVQGIHLKDFLLKDF